MSRLLRSLTVLTALLTMALTGHGADVSVVGDADLVISGATAGSNPPAVTDQTCQLQWSKLGTEATKKITVQTSLVGPRFLLTAEAVSISPGGSGTSAGEISISSSAADFVVSIPGNAVISGTCDLLYQATAEATDGTGIDTHTITYTIVDQ